MTGALPAEVRELLGVVRAAIDIPYPATLGDTARHSDAVQLTAEARPQFDRLARSMRMQLAAAASATVVARAD